MAWLGTYAKRIKVTASNTNVDSDLTHFPLLLTLGTSVGTGSTDVSAVFDELTSNDNRKKIAVTKTDGTTELYVEIEKWDDANEKAVLWVSKSDLVLSSSGTTDLYLYYDSSHADNDTYVGDTNDVVAESVWDSNFKTVFHMADGASTSSTYDSTSNDNDGTKTAANEPIVTSSGEIGNAQDFDGTDDYMEVTYSSELDFSGAGKSLTLEAIISTDKLNSDGGIIGMWDVPSAQQNQQYILKFESDNNQIKGAIQNNDLSFSVASSATGSVSQSTLVYVVMQASGGTITMYINGVTSGGTDTYDTLRAPDTNQNIGIGVDNRVLAAERFEGIIDEVRISSIARPVAWLKANNSNLFDDIVSWGSEEEAPTTNIKSVNGLLKASIKSINGLAIGSIKNINGLE